MSEQEQRGHGYWCSDACAASDEHMEAMDREAWEQIALAEQEDGT